jgi:sulfide:quinone oxidoreductase
VAKLRAIPQRAKILIAGGGVAGLEALIALRALLGGTVEIELLAPDVEFSYRPIAVAEPFGLGEVRRFPLAKIAADHGAHYRHGALIAVAPEGRIAATDLDLERAYDYLVVATGARPRPGIEGALSFGAGGERNAVEELLAKAEQGSMRRLIFAAPPPIAWVLPLYELALFTAAWARQRGLVDLELSIATPEARPLEAFGAAAGDAIAELLADAGVALHLGVAGQRFDGDQLVTVVGAIPADGVIALPSLEGPRVPGLPHDRDGFIPIDRHGAVRGVTRVYAAGDGTSFPIKQGGLAAQQADAVAEAIAAELGAISDARPFRPVLRGLLLTGAEPRYLRAGDDRSEVSFQPLWWPPGKIAGRYIAPYLGRPDDPALSRETFVDRPGPAEPESPEQAKAEEREAVELLFALADASASREEFGFAIKCLDAAEDVGGALPPARQRERRRWEQLGVRVRSE